MGENFKKLQEDMVNWQSDYQNAEREYEQMNEDLLQEVSLSVPAVTRPETAANPPIVSLPQVSTSQFAVPQSVNVSQSAGQSVDARLHAEWVTVQALNVKLASAYVALALGLSTFTTLLVWTLCTRTHEPGSGDVKL